MTDRSATPAAATESAMIRLASQGWNLCCGPFATAAGVCRAGVALAALFLGFAILSAVRATLDGTVNADISNSSLNVKIGLHIAVGVLCAPLGLLFIKIWRSRARVSLGQLLGIALLIHICAFPTLPYSSNDLFFNLASGRLVELGRNPYQETAADLGNDPFQTFVAPMWRHWHTPYGPLTVWSGRPAVASGDVWISLWTYKAEIFAALLVMLGLAYAYCLRIADPQQGQRTFVLFAWHPLLAWEISAQAHNDGLMLLGATAFVVAACRQRPWAAWASMLAALFAKLAVAPVMGLYLCCQARRSVWRAAGMVILLVAAGWASYGPFWMGPKTLTNSLAEAASGPDHLNQSMLAEFHHWAQMVGERPATAVYDVWSTVARWSFLAIAAWFALRAKSVAQALRDATTYLVLFLALGKGWFMPWYPLWLLPLGLAETDRRRQDLIAYCCLFAPLMYISSSAVVVLGVHLVSLGLLWRCRNCAVAALAETTDGERATSTAMFGADQSSETLGPARRAA